MEEVKSGAEVVSALVSNVGFPIVAFLLMCAVCWYMLKTHKEEIATLTTALDNLKKALTDNTNAIEMLKTHIKS